MNSRNKVLVVDDEPDFLFTMSQVLTAKGYKVSTAIGVDQGLEQYNSFTPDLIILDRMMPVRNGDEMLAEIRSKDLRTPILLLTALTSLDDVLDGFEKGANDYIKKPFAMRELMFRVNSLIQLTHPAQQPLTILTVGGFTLNTVSQILCFHDEPIAITTMEYLLLKILFENKNHEVSLNSIIQALWNFEGGYSSTNVQVYACKIKKILRMDPEVKLISLRSVGYKLVELGKHEE